MIFREVKNNKDAMLVGEFGQREFAKRGVKAQISPAWVRLQLTKGIYRFQMMIEDDKVVAFAVASIVHTREGVAWWGDILLVDSDHPDQLKTLDALMLYALQEAVFEGIYAIHSAALGRGAWVYEKDDMGMEVQSIGKDAEGKDNYRAYGDAREMMKVIVKRRPEWVLSL